MRTVSEFAYTFTGCVRFLPQTGLWWCYHFKIEMRAGARTLIDSIPDESLSQETGLSFDEVFTLHHRAVFATARSVVRDTTLAEEISQEVFLKLYRHFDTKPNGELLRPWLL